MRVVIHKWIKEAESENNILAAAFFEECLNAYEINFSRRLLVKKGSPEMRIYNMRTEMNKWDYFGVTWKEFFETSYHPEHKIRNLAETSLW